MSEISTKILITDLELVMSIGIHAHEKAESQRVLVNITLYTDNYVPDRIEDAVCYETICNRVSALSQSKHYDMIERFAEDVAEISLREDRVLKVRVRAEKPDIIENTKSVGVEITRTR